MPRDNPECESSQGHGPAFTTTHWTVVFAAQDSTDSQSAAALEELCRAYWRPLYAYIRRCGHDVEAAQDLTQSFFERLLARRDLKAVNPEKGRFRSFILAALKHFLANEWDRQTAVKRGGRFQFISLETAGAEIEFQVEGRRQLAPDRLYERRWALVLLENVHEQLQAEYHSQGKQDLFAALSVYLTCDIEAQPYAETAVRLGLSVEATRKAVERMRRRYGRLLRENIARTVSEPWEIDEELRHLRSTLQR